MKFGEVALHNFGEAQRVDSGRPDEAFGYQVIQR